LGAERKRISTNGGLVPNWSTDGEELIGTLIGDTKSPRPTVILNWPAALKR